MTTAQKLAAIHDLLLDLAPVLAACRADYDAFKGGHEYANFTQASRVHGDLEQFAALLARLPSA